jgi:hypothetical protein
MEGCDAKKFLLSFLFNDRRGSYFFGLFFLYERSELTMQVMKIAKNLAGVISKNSPTILTGAAVVGLITSVALAIKATPLAIDLIEEEKQKRLEETPNGEEPVLLTTVDVIKLTWRCYIPTVGMLLATGACIIGANSINQKRYSALAAAYAFTETAFGEYKSKVTETLGKNKEQKLRDEIDADRIKENPPSTNEVIFTGKGEILCYEPMTKRYFKSDHETLRRIMNDLNDELFRSGFVSLNDMFWAIGIPTIKHYDGIGWDPTTTGLIRYYISTHLSEDGQPCLVISFEVEPKFIN